MKPWESQACIGGFTPEDDGEGEFPNCSAAALLAKLAAEEEDEPSVENVSRLEGYEDGLPQPRPVELVANERRRELGEPRGRVVRGVGGDRDLLVPPTIDWGS
jgi:hypothetical protein